MQPKNTLFVKVNIKKHPYSQKAISISVSAATFPKFTVRQAIMFSDLSLKHTNFDTIRNVAKSMQQQSNTEHVVITFTNTASALLQKNQ